MHPQFFLATPKHIGPIHQFLEHQMHMPGGMATAVICVLFLLLCAAAVTATFMKVFS